MKKAINDGERTSEMQGLFTKWDLYQDVVLEGKEGDSRFPEKLGSDLVMLYAQLDGKFLYILLERSNPENLEIETTDYEINLEIDPPGKDFTLQLLVTPGKDGSVNVFKIPRDRDGIEYEAESLGTSVKNEDIGLKVYPRYVEMKVPVSYLESGELDTVADLSFNAPLIQLIDEEGMDRQEFVSLR